MKLKKLTITNFRNYSKLTTSFSPNLNIIVGDNGQGKTNLLESIFVLGMTKSHKSILDKTIIKDNESFAKIEGVIETQTIPINLEVLLQPTKKEMKIDNNKINKISEYITKLSLIFFYPEDLNLIKGSPSERRRYLDTQLSQLHPNYVNVLIEYNKILKQRNELLKTNKINNESSVKYFEILTESLIKRGTTLYQYRENYIKNINKNVCEIYKNISGINNFKINYKPSIDIYDYNKKYIEKTFKTELLKSQNSEIKLGVTLVGPHRDDFEFIVNGKDLKIYGSQGQQRIAVLAMKLSEVPIFKKYKNVYPILLLDDIFSELDDNKKNNLLKYIFNNIQIFITTTDLTSINKDILKKANIIKIHNGNIIK